MLVSELHQKVEEILSICTELVDGQSDETLLPEDAGERLNAISVLIDQMCHIDKETGVFKVVLTPNVDELEYLKECVKLLRESIGEITETQTVEAMAHSLGLLNRDIARIFWINNGSIAGVKGINDAFKFPWLYSLIENVNIEALFYKAFLNLNRLDAKHKNSHLEEIRILFASSEKAFKKLEEAQILFHTTSNPISSFLRDLYILATTLESQITVNSFSHYNTRYITLQYLFLEQTSSNIQSNKVWSLPKYTTRNPEGLLSIKGYANDAYQELEHPDGGSYLYNPTTQDLYCAIPMHSVEGTFLFIKAVTDNVDIIHVNGILGFPYDFLTKNLAENHSKQMKTLIQTQKELAEKYSFLTQ